MRRLICNLATRVYVNAANVRGSGSFVGGRERERALLFSMGVQCKFSMLHKSKSQVAVQLSV